MKKRGKILMAGILMMLAAAPGTALADTVSPYENVAVSQVTNYVNVRTEPRIGSSIVGKIYNNCAATILATVDGEGGKWYQIKSGTVEGYIKAEFFITGADAEKIAKEIGTVYVTIDADNLRLRKEPNLDSEILTLLSQNDEYIELGEEGEFMKIQVDADLSGYVHKDYIKERVEFEQAVSLAEEQAKREEAEKRKREADEAIAHLQQLQNQSQAQSQENAAPETNTGSEVGIIISNPMGEAETNGSQPGKDSETNSSSSGPSVGKVDTDLKPGVGNTGGPGSSGGNSGNSGGNSGNSSGNTSGPGGGNNSSSQNTNAEAPAGLGSAELTSATRQAIVSYAMQFLGNPYVYGGTSLTEGADCSGFTMRIYEHFGIDTGRTSRDQAAKGKTIPVDSVQPGDLIFYASGDYINHVAMYIGNGEIIHASTAKTGIKISTMNYRTPYKAVTFLD